MSGAVDRPYEGAFLGRTHHFALRVYFEDTDVSGVVYHGNYLKYMERARSDMLRAAGIDASCAIHQRVMRGPDILTEARVTAAFVADGRPRRQPRAWVEVFRRLTEEGD